MEFHPRLQKRDLIVEKKRHYLLTNFGVPNGMLARVWERVQEREFLVYLHEWRCIVESVVYRMEIGTRDHGEYIVLLLLDDFFHMHRRAGRMAYVVELRWLLDRKKF